MHIGSFHARFFVAWRSWSIPHGEEICEENRKGECEGVSWGKLETKGGILYTFELQRERER